MLIKSLLYSRHFFQIGVWDHSSDQDIPGLNILLDAFKLINLKTKYGCSSRHLTSGLI